MFALDAGYDLDEVDVDGYLAGLIAIPVLQRDVVAQAINELLDARRSPLDGAHYSSADAASKLGFYSHLRPVILTPDDYDFWKAAPRLHSLNASSPEDMEGLEVAEVDSENEMALELRRCHALFESGLLDTGPEDRFDRITKSMQDHLGFGSASIALIAEDSQIIKSLAGLIGQDLPRHLSRCNRTIVEDRTLVITDASTDPTFQNRVQVPETVVAALIRVPFTGCSGVQVQATFTKVPPCMGVGSAVMLRLVV